MKAKLTKEFVDRLEPDPDPKKRLTVWDTELSGFGITVTPPGTRGGGVKSYIVQYRPGGRGTPTRRVTIGRHGPEWQPKAAREEAAEILRQRRKGIDPFEERARQREAEQAALVLATDTKAQARRFEYAAFCDEFMETYAKPKQPRSWEGTQRALLDLGRELGSCRVDRLKRDTIREALGKLVKRSPSAGIAAHKALRKLFNWATAETIFTWHPMIDMDPPAKGNVRKRVLTSTELKAVWDGAIAMGYPFGFMYALILVTGLRLRDVAEAVWGEYHEEHEALIIAASRMKRSPDDVRGDFLVPLSGYALMIIEILPKIDPPEGVALAPELRPLFTSKGIKPISGFSEAKRDLDAMIEEMTGKALPHWTTHDLRRTMATVMQPLGVPANIIDRLQDHRDKHMSKTALHYQHWDFMDEKREAAQLYRDYLAGALDGEARFMDLVRKVDVRLNV